MQINVWIFQWIAYSQGNHEWQKLLLERKAKRYTATNVCVLKLWGTIVAVTVVIAVGSVLNRRRF